MIEYRAGRYWQEHEVSGDTIYNCFEIEFINDGIKWFSENWWKIHNHAALTAFVNDSVFHNCTKWEPTYTQRDELAYIDGRVIRPAELLSCGMIFYYKVTDG